MSEYITIGELSGFEFERDIHEALPLEELLEGQE